MIELKVFLFLFKEIESPIKNWMEKDLLPR